MNKKLLLSTLCITAGLLSVVQRIDNKTLDKIKSDLKEFHKPLSSTQDQRPDISVYKKSGHVLVAKMDSFGLDRYFTFQTDEDMKNLVEGVQNGGGWDVRWYYLQNPEKYESITSQTKK